MDRVVLWLKREQSPLAKVLKRTLLFVMHPPIPRLPQVLSPVLRAIYELHWQVITFCRTLVTVLYRGPLLQARCASFGKGVRLNGTLPFIFGHVRIHVGDNVEFGSNIIITASRLYDEPRLIIGNKAALGWNTRISVSQEVIIEDDVWLPFNCTISDSDGHPREMDLRLAKQPPSLRDVRPVRICKGAWIGNGSQIMKGVTIGEGAVIGAQSVVITDIPPYALAMGNPAEVIIRNFGLPSTEKHNRKTATRAAGA